jgi:hypothetical protein
MSEGGGGDNIAVAYTTDGSFPTDGAEPIPGNQLRSFDKADGPLTTTTVPTNTTVAAGQPVTFTVGVPNGTPPYTYEWFRDGVALVDDLGNPVSGTRYSIPRVDVADNNAKFSVRITNPSGSITTPDATLTVVNDTTPPRMAKVTSSDTFSHVIITFSEPMADAAATAANYTLSSGVTITAAEFQIFDDSDPSLLTNKMVVRLTTSTQPQNTTITLTANAANVKDIYGNAVSPNTATFRTYEFRTGLVLYKRWNNINSLTTLTNDPANFDTPTVVETRSIVETGGDFAENFTSQMKGFFMPATTGDYVFYGASDDNMLMFLSTDADPANQKLILADVGWQNNREWTGIGSATTTGNGTDVAYVYRRGQVNEADPFGPWVGPFENRSDQFLTSARYTSTFSAYDPWPTTDANGNAKITLQAGQRYYFEVLHQEGTGGDRAQVTFKLATETDPANGTASRMTGSLIGAVVDASALPPVFISRPFSTNYNKGATITMNAVAEGATGYQWLRNKKPIPGATSSTYTIASADHTHVGDYSVLATNANGAVESNFRSADDSARLIMNGAFVIEAEDYNYEGGKHLSAASTMPYLGNLYSGLLPTLDVDYFNAPDQSTASTDADAYGPRMPVTGPAYIETKGDGDSINNALNRNRGSFSVTNNYALGWGDNGDWQNYTRTFPAGRYAIYAGAAMDGDPDATDGVLNPATRPNQLNSTLSLVANPTIPDNSSRIAGGNTNTEGGAQGLTKLGVFRSPQSGAWSSNDIIPLTDETSGLPVEVLLSGTQTLRWTANSGLDSDFLLLYCLNCDGPGGATIRLTRTAGTITIDFTGLLVASETVDGDYTPVAGATEGTPYVVSPSGTMRFFQARTP